MLGKEKIEKTEDTSRLTLTQLTWLWSFLNFRQFFFYEWRNVCAKMTFRSSLYYPIETYFISKPTGYNFTHVSEHFLLIYFCIKWPSDNFYLTDTLLRLKDDRVLLMFEHIFFWLYFLRKLLNLGIWYDKFRKEEW